MYGPSFVERRAASPNPPPRTTSHTNSNHHSNVHSSDSVVSRSTSASRSRSATINRRNSNDEVTANGRSDSRGRSRYATINGPVSPCSATNSRQRSVSTERRRRSTLDNNDGDIREEDPYPTLTGSSENDSASIGRAINKLESSRNELHAQSSPKFQNRNARSNFNSGPVSLLKQEADSTDASYGNNNNIYAASALSKDRKAVGGSNPTGNTVSNGRRGSYDTVHSTDSTMSHLSVSTVSSHRNRPNNSANHPTHNVSNNVNTYPSERPMSTVGLQRSPPLSAASHRHRNQYDNNSPSNRDANRRRYSEVTDSTDANYSSIRHHEYNLEDINTDPTRPPVYATEPYVANINITSAGQPVQGDTQFYPIHYLDAESVGREVSNGVIIEGKNKINNNRRGTDSSRVRSPKVSKPDEGHISSSSSSANDRDVPYSNEKNERAFHVQKNSNDQDPDSFMEMKALDYINRYYRGDNTGNSSTGNFSHADNAQKKIIKTNQQQAPTPWTLSKYNTVPNSSSTSNNNISSSSRPNANSNSKSKGDAGNSKRTKTPQLAVYRGRGASTDMTEETTARISQNAVTNIRASIPKVPVPSVEAVPQIKEPVYHNAAQADMAGYIESMRRRKV